MLPLIRGTSRVMEIQTSGKELLSFLGTRFPLLSEELPVLMGRSTAGDTVLIFSEEKDRGYLFRGTTPEKLLEHIINAQKAFLLEKITLLPRIILMRIPEKLPQVVEQIREDFHATPVPLESIDPRGNIRGVAVCFTTSRLNRNIPPEAFYSTALDIPLPYGPLYQQLRVRAFGYINQGMEKRDWYETNIMIYDKYERYVPLYKRVMLVLMDLGVGLILGESWEKDYGRVLLPLQVYRIRLFTFLEPGEIKKILLGLEYAAGGIRLCDLDLRRGKKKEISWTEQKEKKGSREELGLQSRQNILEELSEKHREKFLALEEELLEAEGKAPPAP